MGSTPRLLIVEDHPDSREILTILLRQSEFEVVSTDKGGAALDLARQEKFDLYLLDSLLPDITGSELCSAIRQFDTATPVVFYSACAQDSEIEKALLNGAQAYIVKPASAEEIVKTLRMAIERQAKSATDRPPNRVKN